VTQTLYLLKQHHCIKLQSKCSRRKVRHSSTLNVFLRWSMWLQMHLITINSFHNARDCGLHRHPLLWCQQHVVHRLETEPLWMLDHAHGTVYQSLSLTARHLSPSRNISRLIYLVCLFRARFDCVKRPCSSLGRLRRCNFVTLHYITLHYITLHP